MHNFQQQPQQQTGQVQLNLNAMVAGAIGPAITTHLLHAAYPDPAALSVAVDDIRAQAKRTINAHFDGMRGVPQFAAAVVDGTLETARLKAHELLKQACAGLLGDVSGGNGKARLFSTDQP